jgi:hypothetical protein
MACLTGLSARNRSGPQSPKLPITAAAGVGAQDRALDALIGTLDRVLPVR